MTVYLLHFDRPLSGHAQHYIGYCNGDESLDARMDRHRRGDGARILRAATEAGIDFRVVRTWPEGDRNLERRLKRWKKAWQLCPLCKDRRRKGRRAA